MSKENKSDYFIGVGSTINTIRFIGPFDRLVLAKKKFSACVFVNVSEFF